MDQNIYRSTTIKAIKISSLRIEMKLEIIQLIYQAQQL